MKTQKTLPEILNWRTAQNPDQVLFTFLRDGEKEKINMSAGELHNSANRIAGYLLERKKRQQPVLLLFPEGLEFVKAFYGCLISGAIAVPANPSIFSRNYLRLESIATDSTAKLILSARSLKEKILKNVAPDSILHKQEWVCFEDVVSRDSSEVSKEVEPSELALLQYTSGSVGNPKGVMLTHGNLTSNQKVIAKVCEYPKDCVSVVWLPVYHDMGLVEKAMQPVFAGLHTISTSPLSVLQRPIRWLNIMSDYKAHKSGGPNFFYDFCVEKLKDKDLTHLDLKNWKLAYNAAEPVHKSTMTRFYEMLKPYGFSKTTFYPCYGMAESTLYITGGKIDEEPKYDSSNLLRKKNSNGTPGGGQHFAFLDRVSCGRTWEDQEVIIVNPETREKLNENNEGEIWTRGESVGVGYWNKRELTKKCFHAFTANDTDGPWLRTGDLGYFKNKKLYISGRLKDIVIVNGKKYYPHDIERVAEQSHDALKSNCAAAFQVFENNSEELFLICEVKRDRISGLSEAKVSSEIRRSVWLHFGLLLHSIYFTKPSVIPKTSSGKIQRFVCKKMFLGNEIKPIAKWTTRL